jgi:hypothetical protein
MPLSADDAPIKGTTGVLCSKHKKRARQVQGPDNPAGNTALYAA